MKRLVLVLITLLSFRTDLYAQGSSAIFHRESHSQNTSAVDTKGLRHHGSAYKGGPPWFRDRVSGPAPDYPVTERRKRHEGLAIVRLTLDLKTGRVIKGSLLKSCGYPTLDHCAIAALSRWTWRPGRWKEIDMPVRFRMGDASRPPPPGAIRLPR